MKFYVDKDGKFLDARDDDQVPDGGLEVPCMPSENAIRQTWDFEKQEWSAPVVLREDVDALRLQAYADPLTGSDRYFSEAVRLQIMSGTPEEIEAARSAGVARYAEIQAQYPWPDEPAEQAQ